MRSLFTVLGFWGICFSPSFAQTAIWQSFTDSITTLSSPRACDLNNDGIKDIVIGGGTDSTFSNNGVMAFDGANGNLLWKRSSRNEVFGSAIFQDVNNDGTPDVFIVGRSTQFFCINGANGNLIWDFFPYPTNPADSGWYNFYNPQFIADVSGDNIPDLLVSNGGDHAAPPWVTNRPAGRLLVLNSATGAILADATVPDSAEIYCSPIVADIKNDGTMWVLYGTGGETLGGSFWACPLSDLLNNTLQNSVELITDASKGYIAPASIFKTSNGSYDIVVQSFGGSLSRFRGSDFAHLWSVHFPNTESSAAPVLGNFTGSFTPDVFAVLYKGSTLGGYSDYYQVMLDGDNGNIVFKDSLGSLHFASANALDMNNDGRDEAIISISQFNAGRFQHRLLSIDFANAQINQIGNNETGANVASTPLFTTLTNSNDLDLVYVVKKDSMNPMGWKGIYVNRWSLQRTVPNAGIAWGSYMGNKHDGKYNYLPQPCSTGTVVSSSAIAHPTCNHHSDGGLALSLANSSAQHTFVWSNGASTDMVTGIGAGTYTVRVTNDAGCYEDLSFTLQDPFLIQFGGITPVACAGDSNGTATVSSSGCQCMFSTCTFLWSNGVTTKPNSNLRAGWNYVTITHMNGCITVDSVQINVTDSSAPTITAPSNITVTADAGSCTVAGLALGNATTADNCGGSISVQNDANNLQVGINTVTWTATDGNGNSSTATQTVTILDAEDPQLTNCTNNITVTANAASCSALVTWTLPSATDNCNTALVMTSTPANGSIFGLGTTTVDYLIEDASGNSTTCSFSVEVVNNLAASTTITDASGGNNNGRAQQAEPRLTALFGRVAMVLMPTQKILQD